MPFGVPLTSVVTATYNMGHYLKRLAYSLARQTSQDFEWIVLDDGSTDQTVELIPQTARLIRFSKHLGLTAARNRLLEEARGEFISILDADDLFLPTKVEFHATVLKSSPDVGVVWGRTLMFYPNDWKVLPQESPQLDWDLLSDYCATHSATTWRKSALVKAGGYDPEKVLVEGPDLFLKVGDFSRQVFYGHLACVKFINTENEFRKKIREQGANLLSQRLRDETLVRRFGHKARVLK